jgi:hypothetical protein
MPLDLNLKPNLEIPNEVWDFLEDRDFVNFPVPLLNPPAETENGLVWSGHELVMLSDTLAAFEKDDDASCYMPYGEMFKIVANEDETRFAQIYAIFFEKMDGEWEMLYRLMNCDRVFSESGQAVPVPLDSSESSDNPLSSNWMLSLSGIDNWLTLDAYLNFYCRARSYNIPDVTANIYKQLDYMEGAIWDKRDIRVMTMPGDIIVLVSKLTKGWALMIDVVNNSRLARFVMDDPPHLIESFWRIHSKIFLSSSDILEMNGMLSDARHFSYALKSAREQKLIDEEITAAAFYC